MSGVDLFDRRYFVDSFDIKSLSYRFRLEFIAVSLADLYLFNVYSTLFYRFLQVYYHHVIYSSNNISIGNIYELHIYLNSYLSAVTCAALVTMIRMKIEMHICTYGLSKNYNYLRDNHRRCLYT